MSIDRITHLVEQMHRSEDDAGDPITTDFLLAADGTRGLQWIDPTTLVPGGLAGLADIITGLTSHGNLGASETFDADIGTHTGTLDTASCTFTLTGFDVGESNAMAIWLTQDGTGGRVIDLPAAVVNAAELEAAQDTTAGTTSILVLWSVDGGSSILGGWWGQSAATLSDNDPEDVGTAPDSGVGDEASRYDHVHALSEATLQDIGHYEVVVSGTGPPVAVSNPDDDDWLYAWVSG